VEAALGHRHTAGGRRLRQKQLLVRLVGPQHAPLRREVLEELGVLDHVPDALVDAADVRVLSLGFQAGEKLLRRCAGGSKWVEDSRNDSACVNSVQRSRVTRVGSES